jgi:UDP-3-O-[3-hydroxymyristoyl] N-acetylglucosamine deacetylase
VDIPARAENVGDTTLGTTLVKGEARSPRSSTCCRPSPASASTTPGRSHAAEVPIMDGSAGPFVFLLQSAGIEEQKAPKRFIRVRKRAGRGRRQVGALRSVRRIQGEFRNRIRSPDLQAPLQRATMDFSTTSFLKEISRARTFGFMRDLETCARTTWRSAARSTMRSCWMMSGVLNEDGLRYEDEFVKHKILDAIGDLYLLGHSLIGEFSGFTNPDTASTTSCCAR